MKSVFVCLALATKVIAWEQIYAAYSGNITHTDSDGIVYETIQGFKTSTMNGLDIGMVPESDRILYNRSKWIRANDPSIAFKIPLTNDGYYVIIAKFPLGWCSSAQDIMDRTLNGKIRLLTNVESCSLTGGHLKTIDKYFFFCVANETVHYKNQTSQIRDGHIHIEYRSVQNEAYISGLVLLKGSLGESGNLISSNANEEFYFDPLKMHPMCLIETSK
jgi:hypothetical protein